MTSKCSFLCSHLMWFDLSAALSVVVLVQYWLVDEVKSCPAGSVVISEEAFLTGGKHSPSDSLDEEKERKKVWSLFRG